MLYMATENRLCSRFMGLLKLKLGILGKKSVDAWDKEQRAKAKEMDGI